MPNWAEMAHAGVFVGIVGVVSGREGALKHPLADASHEAEVILGLAQTGVRDALVLLAEEIAIAVAVTVTPVTRSAVPILKDALPLLVAALETLAAGVIVGPAATVEASLLQSCLPAAPDPASFVLNFGNSFS